MNNIKNIKAILFDLDGTLVHDEEAQKQAFKKTLESFKIFLSQEETLEKKEKNFFCRSCLKKQFFVPLTPKSCLIF